MPQREREREREAIDKSFIIGKSFFSTFFFTGDERRFGLELLCFRWLKKILSQQKQIIVSFVLFLGKKERITSTCCGFFFLFLAKSFRTKSKELDQA